MGKKRINFSYLLLNILGEEMMGNRDLNAATFSEMTIEVHLVGDEVSISGDSYTNLYDFDDEKEQLALLVIIFNDDRFKEIIVTIKKSEDFTEV